jgi:hypothetical protein
MIITLVDYKAYAGVANPKSDEKLQFIVDFVNEFIVRYCNTTFQATTVTGARVGSYNGTEIILPNAPLISVERLQLVSSDDPLDPTTYTIDTAEGTIESFTSFTSNRFAYEVDYTHGYPEAPSDLLLAGLEFVTHLSKREFTKSRNLGNGESADYGDPELIPAQIRLGLNMYKVL